MPSIKKLWYLLKNARSIKGRLNSSRPFFELNIVPPPTDLPHGMRLLKDKRSQLENKSDQPAGTGDTYHAASHWLRPADIDITEEEINTGRVTYAFNFAIVGNKYYVTTRSVSNYLRKLVFIADYNISNNIDADNNLNHIVHMIQNGIVMVESKENHTDNKGMQDADPSLKNPE
jgi:hypothetical protein